MTRREHPERRVSGERIRELRTQAMMTQRETAKATQVSLSTYQAIEYGDVVSPHFSTIKKLAKALGVDPRDLLEREPCPLAQRPASPSKTQVEILEHALARYEELDERDPVRWGNLHGAALLMVERTEHRDLRDRYEAVARRAWDGWLEAKGIDCEDADAQEAVEELIGDILGESEVREHIQA